MSDPLKDNQNVPHPPDVPETIRDENTRVLDSESLREEPQGAVKKTGGGTRNGGPPSGPKAPLPLRLIFLLLKALVVLVGGLFALIYLVLFIVIFFFPINTVKDIALEEARGMLNQEINIGDMSLNLLTGLDINDIYLGPPKGYTKPIFTMKKIAVHYSLWGLPFGQVTVEEILLDSPHANVETIDGKMNVLAMLDNLPKGEEKPEEPEPEPEPEPETPGEPSDFKIVLERFDLKNVSAWADTGAQLVDFKKLGLHVAGHFSQIDSHFDVGLKIEGDDPEAANIHFEQTDPMPAKADILLALGIDIAADHVLEPKADVNVNLRVATKKLETEWDLKPVDLRVGIQTTADMKEDYADLKSLAVHFNDEQLIKLNAYLKGLLEQKSVNLLLEKLHLPLDTFAPYAKAFVSGVDFGGSISIDKLAVKGDVPKLLEQGLPELNGTVNIENVWADYAPEKARIRGLNMNLGLETRPVESANGLEEPALKAAGNIGIQSAGVPMAGIEDFKLDLDVRANGLELSQALAKIKLDIPKIVYNDPKMGQARISLGTDIEAGGNIVAGEFNVDHVDVSVADVIKLHLDAEASVDQATQAVRHYRVALNLDPISFPKLIRLAPPGARRMIPKMDLSGSLGLRVASSGSVPPGVGDPFKLPVELETVIELAGISVNYPDQQVSLKNFGGQITVKGKPSDMAVTGELHLDHLEKPDQFATLKGLGIPIDIHYTPEKADINIGVEIAHLKKEDQAAQMEGLKVSVNAGAYGNLLKKKLQKLTGGIGVDIDHITYAKEVTTKVNGEHLKLDFDYLQDKKEGNLKFSFGIDDMAVPEQATHIKGFLFSIGAQVQGVDIPIVPNPDQHAELAWVSMDMDIDSIEKSDALPEPLLGTNLRSRLLLHDMRDADLEKFVFLIPTLGVKYEMSGKVWGVLNKKLEPPNFKNVWPEFDVQLFAGIDLPEKRHLIGGLDMQGLAGIKARARSLPDNFARMEGAIVAKDFYLWNKSKGEKEYPNGRKEPTSMYLRLKDFDADVPLIQLVNLESMAPVEAKGNIFEQGSRNVLYDVMRHYMKRNANFHIDQIAVTMTEGATMKNVAVDEVALDMIYNDNTFSIDRMYLGLLGGGITGALQAQIAALPPAPLDVRIHFENQITGVNLARLTETDEKKITPETEISTLVNLNFGLRDRFVEGRVDITKLSLKQLDKMLKFLDPDGKDPNVQNNRDLINSWYINMVNPQVKLVSMWIKYGNLNLDINMDAWFFVGTILKNTLKNSRIRRLNIMPILNQFLPPDKPAEEETAAEASDGEEAPQAAGSGG